MVKHSSNEIQAGEKDHVEIGQKSDWECEMGGCCVPGFKNSTKSYRLYQFPKDLVRSRQWKVKIKRTNWTIGSDETLDADQLIADQLHVLSHLSGKHPWLKSLIWFASFVSFFIGYTLRKVKMFNWQSQFQALARRFLRRKLARLAKLCHNMIHKRLIGLTFPAFQLPSC